MSAVNWPRVRWPVAMLACGLSCGMVGLNACARRPPDPLPGFPRLVLWAWEEPEDFAFLRRNATGVAFFAGSVTMADGAFTYRPRMQPLHMPTGTPLIAVVRIESRGDARPPADAVAEAVWQMAGRLPVRALQVDFDARSSERVFYRQLLAAIRKRFPRKVALEMTALVSWCEADRWMYGLPVVDAVPMFFRMGVDPHRTNEKLRAPLCAASIGISTDEFDIQVPRGRRVFVFNPRPWTESAYRAVLEASTKWR